MALIDPGSANVETWVRDDAGVITFLRLPNKREPKTVTEIDLQHAAAQRAVADTEKARVKFLRGQTLQPALRRTDGPNITLSAAIATVEHFEGRIELGPYGEVQVLFPPMLTAPTQTPLVPTPATPTPLAPLPTTRLSSRRHGVTPTRRSR